MKWIACLVLGSSLAASAASYYVATNGNNTNSGLAGSPWLTVQKAANTAVAGDSITVSNGTYAEWVQTKATGTVISPITFTGLNQPSIQGFGLFHEYNYVNGFQMHDTGAVIYAALTFTASNVRMQSNYVHDLHIGATRMVNGSGATPDVSAWPTNVYIGFNTFSNIDTITCVLKCIANNSTIESNRIDTCACDAIDLWGSNNRIRNNVITNTQRDVIGLGLGSENHNDFIQTWRPATNYHSTNNIVEANLVINSYLQLYNLEDDNFTNDFGWWTFRNNCFVNDLNNGNVGIPFCTFENNTFYHAPYNSGSYTPILCFNQANFHGWGAVITNNIFVNCGYSNEADGLKIGYYFGAAGATPQTDYNYVAGLLQFGFPTVAGFSEAHGVNGGNPLFVNIDNGNAQLTASSPALDQGANLSSAFTTDFAGTTRGATWDIGAYEYVPPNPPQFSAGTVRAGRIVRAP